MSKTSKDKISSTSTDKDYALKEYKRLWHIKNKDKIIEKATKWNREHPERRAEIRKKYRDNNRDLIHSKNRIYRMKTRRLVISHYSNGTEACKCCGEDIYQFLTIDHMNGNGNAHRRETGNRGGHHFYIWLRQNSFPEGYQVLCFNCNMSKGFFGACPHTL